MGLDVYLMTPTRLEIPRCVALKFEFRLISKLNLAGMDFSTLNWALLAVYFKVLAKIFSAWLAPIRKFGQRTRRQAQFQQTKKH